jgi:hypothetical protein
MLISVLEKSLTALGVTFLLSINAPAVLALLPIFWSKPQHNVDISSREVTYCTWGDIPSCHQRTYRARTSPNTLERTSA